MGSFRGQIELLEQVGWVERAELTGWKVQVLGNAGNVAEVDSNRSEGLHFHIGEDGIDDEGDCEGVHEHVGTEFLRMDAAEEVVRHAPHELEMVVGLEANILDLQEQELAAAHQDTVLQPQEPRMRKEDVSLLVLETS